MSNFKTIQPSELQQAVAALQRGDLVAFPTETVYGLGADATNAKAIEHLYEVKGRPATRPLTVHLADIEEIPQWASHIPEGAQRLIERFCPGPLTLVLPRRDEVLDIVTAGQKSVGVRLPSHPMARQLIRAFGRGLVAPSANRSGYLSPTSAEHVRQEFGSAVPHVIDGGSCDLGIESTIVDFSSSTPRILRLGMLSADLLQETAGQEIISPEVAKSPSSDHHYRPHTAAHLSPTQSLAEQALGYLQAEGDQVAVLYHSSEVALPKVAGLSAVQLPGTPSLYAQSFYANLRYLDGCCLKAIIIECLPEDDAWLALRERVYRVCNM